DVLVVAFASIGHDPGRMPSPEFVGVLRGRRALFVMDHERSWGTGAGFDVALRAGLAASGPAGRIVALGSSMGAVAALRAAAVMPADAVLAFGPQSRLDDPRWSALTAGLPAPPALPDCWTVLCHGLADDADQARGWAERAGVDHLLFPGIGHSDLAAHLKARGGLQGLVDAACTGDRRRLLRIAGRAGAVQRRKVGLSPLRTDGRLR
ncbi:MAG: hypothetical protein RIR62_2853, partial [Pseudomonadota bacterium]